MKIHIHADGISVYIYNLCFILLLPIQFTVPIDLQWESGIGQFYCLTKEISNFFLHKCFLNSPERRRGTPITVI